MASPLPAFHKPSPRMTLGEAPLYRSSDNTLHWVDPLSTPPRLYIASLSSSDSSANNETYTLSHERVFELEESVSVLAFRKKEKGYICAYYAGIGYLDEETGALRVLKEIVPIEERAERRMNDGGVDKKGRFWVAEIDKVAVSYGLGKLPTSYGPPKGRLWRYDPDGSLHLMFTGLICGNGVEWSLDDKVLYVNDSLGQKIYSFQFDLGKGEISNQKTLADLKGTEGEPDGMVVDSDGNLWISVYGTNSLMYFDPTGKHIKSIKFSGKNLTCPTWGGKDFDTLFITSAQDPGGEAEDEGGNLFSYRDNKAKGAAKNEFPA